MTERIDKGDVWLTHGTFTEAVGSGSTGTRTAVFVTRPDTATSPNNNARAIAFTLRPAVTATAPTVNAGADATIDQYDTFSRTATENDNGATITARTWKVNSGPNQVNETIGTAAALSWAPTVDGTYILRYSATNSAGTGNDDVEVIVSELIFPVSADMVLTATRTVSRNTQVSRSANIVLSAARTAAKEVSSSPTANIKLTGSATGGKINAVSANIKLTASPLPAGKPGSGSVQATIKLLGSSTGVHTTNNVNRSASFVLSAESTALKQASSTRTANVALTAQSTGTKTAIVSRTANTILSANITNTFHASSLFVEAPMVLDAVIADTVHTSLDSAPVANLILSTSTETSSVHNNQNVSATIFLLGVANTERVVSEITRVIRPRADTTTRYELVCVARIPQQNGPPTLIEVEPIEWSSLTHTDELNIPQALNAVCEYSRLSESIVQRLRNMADLPTELWLYRNGKQVFSGPLLGWALNDESLTFSAQGLLAYTRNMHVMADLDYKDTEQFDIVKGLIDQWQDTEFSHYGLNTADIPPSGVVRTIKYSYAELHNVFQRITDLTKLSNGFDVAVDPTSRRLNLYYPFRGVDRSTGEDAVIFDSRNITSSNIICSVAPGDIASDALGTGTKEGREEPFVGTAENIELRTRYGRVGITGTFDQVENQDALNAYLQALLDARKDALVVPGPNARVTVDSDLSTYDVGDTISYQLHNQLFTAGSYRIRKRVVEVNTTGTESVSVEFV